MKLTYRPEIDGLRAIAVFAVILYHAEISILGYKPWGGGFIGVDIFFVISGYLITSIILKELIVTGSFSFKHFYERRIRRLLPALLLVMMVSLPFAWIYLLPNSSVDFSKSILYSLGFTSNFYFHFSGQVYGAESGLFKPFLHTWSLSVEEQFYILFPIFLLITFKYFKKYLVHILILGFIISLGLADWGSRNHPSFNFYVLPTRAWELLAGSILAYYEITRGHRNNYKTLNLILPSIGLLLIGHSILFFNDEMFHPSFYTLSPIIGVCLIIWFSHKDELITKILSTKLFVGIGLISYSLYIWHYPIFVFARLSEFIESEKIFGNTGEIENDLFNKIILVLIISVISIFSFYLIEKPFRDKKNKFKIIISLIIISISLLIIFNFYVIKNNGIEDRFYFTKNYSLNKNYYDQERINFEINYNYDNYDDRKNALIVGNSHGEDVLKILSKTNLKNKVYFNLASPRVKTGDLNFQVSYLYDFLNEKKAVIDSDGFAIVDYDGDFFNHLNKQYKNADLIILSTKYSKNDIQLLDALIKKIKKDSKNIIIFNNTLETLQKFGINRLDYFISRKGKFPDKNDLKNIEEQMFKEIKNKEIVNEKIKLIAKNNNIYLIEMEKILCNTELKRCPSITNEGYKIYMDYGHITDKGAEFFAKIIEKDKLFLKYLNSILNISSN